MADLSITASEVQPGTGDDAQFFNGRAGEAITAGQSVYIDVDTDDTLKLADANNTELTATVKGIAVNDAASGQALQLQTRGAVTIGASASVVQGEIYVLSGTPGGIAPEADIASMDRVTLIGVGDASDGIILSIAPSAVQTT